MGDFVVMKNDDALTVLKAAWSITKKHYELILGVTAFMFAVALAISWVPYIRYLASIPMVFLSVGQMYVVRQLIDGKPTKFSDIFRAFQDQTWMNALLPLAVAGVAIALIQEGMSKVFAGGLIGSLFSLALTLIWIALTAFSGPLIAFKNQSFGQSVDVNIKATTANWKPLLLLALYMLGMLLLCTICFLLPAFFIGLPVMYVAGYLTYACIFEGMNVEALEARYKS